MLDRLELIDMNLLGIENHVLNWAGNIWGGKSSNLMLLVFPIFDMTEILFCFLMFRIIFFKKEGSKGRFEGFSLIGYSGRMQFMWKAGRPSFKLNIIGVQDNWKGCGFTIWFFQEVTSKIFETICIQLEVTGILVWIVKGYNYWVKI